MKTARAIIGLILFSLFVISLMTFPIKEIYTCNLQMIDKISLYTLFSSIVCLLITMIGEKYKRVKKGHLFTKGHLHDIGDE